MRLTEWTPDRALEVAFGQFATEDETDCLGGGRQKYAQVSAEEWVRNAVAENVRLKARVAELEAAHAGMMTRREVLARIREIERTNPHTESARDWYSGWFIAVCEVLNIPRGPLRARMMAAGCEPDLLLNAEREEAGE